MAGMKIGRLSWELQAVILIFSLGVSAAAAAAGVRRVDVHTHFVPPFYREIITARNLTSGGTQVPEWNETTHLGIMAKYNVETSILSISPPSVTFFSHDEAAERRSLARSLNEYAYNLSLRHPGKFQFAATLPLPDVEGAMAEAVYALDSLDAAAILLLGNSNGMYLGNPKLDPLMEVINARNAVVLLHPNVLPGGQDPKSISSYTNAAIYSFICTISFFYFFFKAKRMKGSHYREIQKLCRLRMNPFHL